MAAEVEAPVHTIRKLSAALRGEEATGKTSWAYTAPKPIVGFNFDMGAERAIWGAKYEEFFAGLDIHIEPYTPAHFTGSKLEPEPPKLWGEHDITIYELPQQIQLDDELLHGCRELWAYFIGLLGNAVSDPAVSSIVLDTGTIARRVRADAHLQGLQENKKPSDAPRKQLLQIEWGVPGDAIRNIYTLMAGANKNFIVTHHMTDKYEDVVTIGADGSSKVESRNTGERILEGLPQTPRFVDIMLHSSKNDEGMHNEFVKCGNAPMLEGMPAGTTWDETMKMIEGALGGRVEMPKS